MKLKRRTLKWFYKKNLNKRLGKFIKPKNYQRVEQVIGRFIKDKNNKVIGFKLFDINSMYGKFGGNNK